MGRKKETQSQWVKKLHEKSVYCTKCNSEYMTMARSMKLDLMFLIAMIQSGENIVDLCALLQRIVDGKSIKNTYVRRSHGFNQAYRAIIDKQIERENRLSKAGKIAV